MVVSVSQALHHAASSNPSGVAALTYRGPSQACTKTSYNEFLAQTLHVVQALSIAFGPHLVAQARVAFLCRNHELLLIYLYAVSELQLIAAPLNTRWGVEEISAALRDCDPAMVVCDADLWPLLRPSLGPESERERDTDGLGKKWEREGKGGSFDREDEGRDPQKQPSMMGSIRGVVLLHARDGGEVEAGVAGEGCGSCGRREPFSLPSRSIRSISHEALLALTTAPSSSSSPSPSPSGPALPAEVHCLIYTSGSTGTPKGVMLSHAAQLAQARTKITLGKYHPGTVYLSMAPLFHVAGLNSTLAVTWAGGTQVFLEAGAEGGREGGGEGKGRGGRSLDTTELAVGAIRDLGISTLVLVPTMLSKLLAAVEAGGEGGREGTSVLPSISFLLVGGQALPLPLFLRARASMPQARVFQSYACSEACSSISFLPLALPPALPPPLPPPGSLGHPAPGVEVALLDVEGREEDRGADRERAGREGRFGPTVPSPSAPPDSSSSTETRRPGPGLRPRIFVDKVGKVGEIATRGPHLMNGYWRRPDATAAVLVYPQLSPASLPGSPPLPTLLLPSRPPTGTQAFGTPKKGGKRGGRSGGREASGETEGPWLCTGDLGVMDPDGRFRLVGRLADVIRTGAEKVMSSEVEGVLQMHHCVESAAVVGMPDDVFGEKVVAVVVLREGAGDGQGAVKEELVRHCRRHLAGFKVPREFEFRQVLPVTGSGKVNKHMVRAGLRKGSQESKASGLPAGLRSAL